MEFQDVVRRRRMKREFDTSRPIPAAVVDRIVANALRAPSGGFAQGWGFLVLDTPGDIKLLEDTVVPADKPGWRSTVYQSRLIVVAHSNKDRYLDRYAEPDKGWTDRSEARWTAPYWHIDAGMAALMMLLTAVDEEIGACLFGFIPERFGAYRAAFGVPATHHPIGAVAFGYTDEPPRVMPRPRRPVGDVVKRGRWNSPFEPSDGSKP